MSVGKRVFVIIRVILLSILLLSVLCSCTKKQKEPEETDAAESLPDVVFPKDQFFVHLYGSATDNDENQTVSMRFFTRDEHPEITLIGMDDPKAEKACVGVVQNSLNTPMYRGFYYEELQLQFDFSRLEYGETRTVNSISLRIGEEEQTVDTTGRLFLTRLTKEEEDSQKVAYENGLRLSEGAERCSFDLQGTAGYGLECKGIVDIVIEKIEFRDWYQVQDSKLTLTEIITYPDGAKSEKTIFLDSMEDALPVSLLAGKRLSVYLDLEVENRIPFSAYRTGVDLYYRTGTGGEERLFLPVLSEPPSEYGDADEAVVWMDAYVAPSKSALENTVFLEEYVYQESVLTDEVDFVGSLKTDGIIEIYFLYRGTLPYIRLESINGKALVGRDKIGMGATRNGYEYQEEIYEDYKLGMFYISPDFLDLKPGMQKEIKSIRLSVNGVEKELDIGGRISYIRAENGTIRGPAGWNENHGPNGAKVLTYNAGEVTMVERLEIYGPLKRENVRILVDGRDVGTPEDIFPWTLDAGQTLEAVVDFAYDGVEPNASYFFTALLYIREESGEPRIFRENNVLDGFLRKGRAMNKNALQKFIEQALKKKESA